MPNPNPTFVKQSSKANVQKTVFVQRQGQARFPKLLVHYLPLSPGKMSRMPLVIQQGRLKEGKKTNYFPLFLPHFLSQIKLKYLFPLCTIKLP